MFGGKEKVGGFGGTEVGNGRLVDGDGGCCRRVENKEADLQATGCFPSIRMLPPEASVSLKRKRTEAGVYYLIGGGIPFAGGTSKPKADLTKENGQFFSSPASPQASYEDPLRLSTLALRSLLKPANRSCVFLSQPNVGLIRKANTPEKFSDWVRVVDPGSVLLGSKRNECSPTKRPYNDPRQRNSRLEFS